MSAPLRDEPEFRFSSLRDRDTVEVTIHGDSAIYEVVMAFRAFLLAVGYHPENVNDAVPLM